MTDHLTMATAPTGGTLADAVAAIEATTSGAPAAEEARAQILDFVAAHDDALHRSCLEGHLTGSALVFDHKRERTLLMLHAKIGRWLQPGGHADGEGHLGSVALKEATEETGIEGLRLVTPAIDCDVHTIPARKGEPEHLHLDLRFMVIAPDGAVEQGNHESDALRWCTLDEVIEIAGNDSLVRLARAGFAADHR